MVAEPAGHVDPSSSETGSDSSAERLLVKLSSPTPLGGSVPGRCLETQSRTVSRETFWCSPIAQWGGVGCSLGTLVTPLDKLGCVPRTRLDVIRRLGKKTTETSTTDVYMCVYVLCWCDCLFTFFIFSSNTYGASTVWAETNMQHILVLYN